MRVALPALMLLAACAVPRLDVPNADAISRSNYPRLIPTDRIEARAEQQTIQISPGLSDDLRARATGLQARAASLPAAAQSDTSRSLQARATDLQRRAALMRRTALTDADRERLRAALLRLRQETGDV